jgi:hypothetical protein
MTMDGNDHPPAMYRVANKISCVWDMAADVANTQCCRGFKYRISNITFKTTRKKKKNYTTELIRELNYDFFETPSTFVLSD